MRARLVVCVLLVCTLPLQVRAEPPPLDPARLAAARAHYERGEALYQERNYGAAWLEFNSSYQIHPAPELLFNMGRCEARTRRPREALAHFRAYLAARPEDDEAPAIRKEMAVIEAELRAAPPETAAPDLAPAGPAGPPRDPFALPPPPPPPPPLAQRLPLYTLIGAGVGVALLVSGIAAAAVGQSRLEALSGRCGSYCAPEETAPVQTMRAAGFAVLGVGAAITVAAGIVMPFEVGWRRPRPSPPR